MLMGEAASWVERFLGRLVKAYPSLPYAALGVWLAWFFLASSGAAWLSDTEVDGTSITGFYKVANVVMGMVLVLSALFPKATSKVLSSPWTLPASACLSAFGCVLVILVGPYYLMDTLSAQLRWLFFYGGSAVSGLGMGVVALRCADLYGAIAPRRVILCTASSHIVVSLVFFVVMGAPSFAPRSGGPTLVGILAFAGLPLLAAGLVHLSRYLPSGEGGGEAPFHGESVRDLPRPFGRLVLAVAVFSLVCAAVRAVVVDATPADATIEGTRVVMVLRMVFAAVFAGLAVGADENSFDFGRIYSIIMTVAVALVAFCPLVDFLRLIWVQLMSTAANLFDFVLWCILAFVVYQKHLSPRIVFGLAYGTFLLCGGLGWTLGVCMSAWMTDGTGRMVVYLALAFLVLVFAFLMFSEKEFDSLFKPANNAEESLDALLAKSVSAGKVGEGAKGRFSEAVEELSCRCHLSPREKDVLRYLAKGNDAYAIAEKLQVSWNTVRTHTRNVYSKLGVHSKQELISLVESEVAHH